MIEPVTQSVKILKPPPLCQPSFRPPDLGVAAWQADPETFGLPGHDHPDSNKVLSVLMGTRKGLVDRGLLCRVAPLMYSLTDEGRQALKGPIKLVLCRECSKELQANEAVAYGGRCEDCWS